MNTSNIKRMIKKAGKLQMKKSRAARQGLTLKFKPSKSGYNDKTTDKFNAGRVTAKRNDKTQINIEAPYPFTY